MPLSRNSRLRKVFYLAHITKERMPQLEYEKNRIRNVQRLVFIVDAEGTPLTPTNPYKANVLLKRGKAKVFRNGTPYVLQLNEVASGVCIVPLWAEIEMKNETTLKITTIFRRGLHTTMFPYYIHLNPNTSVDWIVRKAVDFTGEIFNHSLLTKVTVVYDDPKMTSTLDAIYRALVAHKDNDDRYDGTVISRRSFTRVSTWRNRQKEKRAEKYVKHVMAEKFFGYFATYSDNVDNTNATWYFKLCRDFVNHIFIPFIRHLSNERKLPDKLRFASFRQLYRYTIYRFKNMDLNLIHLVRKGLVELY